MKVIMKNTWLILRNTKGFISSITVWPIIMLLLLTFTLAYSTSHKIAVIDLSTDGTGAVIQNELEKTEGLELLSVTNDKVTEKLLAGNIELGVIVHNEGKTDIVQTSEGSEVLDAVKEIIRNSNNSMDENISASVNQIGKKGLNMSYSLGLMLFKFITAGSSLASLIILDRRKGMKSRIFLSGIHSGAYLAGRAFIQFIVMGATALVYYIFCLIFHFDFGMQTSLYFLLMVLLTNVFSIGVFTFLSSVLKQENALWSVSTFIFFPMALFSGALFPYENMPHWMQNVGSVFPQRWITKSIEIIQKKNSIIPALPYIGVLLAVTIILFTVASIRTKKLSA